MTFSNVKCPLEILLLGGSRQVLVSLQYKYIPSIRVVKAIRRIRTYMGVEEERVRSPREGFGTNVEVIVVGRKGEVAIVLDLEVFQMLSVLGLNLLHPEVASPDCFIRVNSNLSFCRDKISLACGEADVEADLTPEVGGVWREDWTNPREMQEDMAHL